MHGIVQRHTDHTVICKRALLCPGLLPVLLPLPEPARAALPRLQRLQGAVLPRAAHARRRLRDARRERGAAVSAARRTDAAESPRDDAGASVCASCFRDNCMAN